MKEQLFTIPVGDAFRTDCECPVCKLYEDLEKNPLSLSWDQAIWKMMSVWKPMKLDFAATIFKKMYGYQNRLGLALMLHTHMKRTNDRIETLLKSQTSPKKDYLEKKKPIL